MSRPMSLGGIDRAAADLRELGERAAKRGMRVGFEALAWGRHINDYRDAWEVVRRADHPAVGLVLDSFHILARRTDLDAIRAIPGDHIFLVQLADAPWLDMDVLSLEPALPQHSRPGRFAARRLHGRGAGHRLRRAALAGDLQRPVPRRLGAQRRDRRPALAGLSARPAAARVRQRWPGLPAMPPRAQCLGVEFIEFAADERPAAELGEAVAGLGFRKAGQHNSKEVTRWSQGGINIVVNSEKEGFAHSYNITHGTSVCAMGLRVDDAAATLDRAQKLLDTPFRQAVGPGELEIPAVRGLGGSLIYFVDPTSDLAGSGTSNSTRSPAGQRARGMPA